MFKIISRTYLLFFRNSDEQMANPKGFVNIIRSRAAFRDAGNSTRWNREMKFCKNILGRNRLHADQKEIELVSDCRKTTRKEIL